METKKLTEQIKQSLLYLFWPLFKIYFVHLNRKISRHWIQPLRLDPENYI